MSKTKMTLKGFAPILKALGVDIKGQRVYEVRILATVMEPVRVTIERFLECDTGELKKICENYELVKKEE